jgi:hypothetical protein
VDPCWLRNQLGGDIRGTVLSVKLSLDLDFYHNQEDRWSQLIGGIIATYSFLSSDAPFYTKGYAIGLSFTCLSTVSCVAYAVVIWNENKRRQKSAENLSLTDYEKSELGVSLTQSQ